MVDCVHSSWQEGSPAALLGTLDLPPPTSYCEQPSGAELRVVSHEVPPHSSHTQQLNLIRKSSGN
eukprot:9838475-Prorocentrum_lima.AAC.1